MGFWFFMTVMNILIPSAMIGFGRCFMKKPPKNINYWFGYRTTMSMKNRDTWEFAHRYCGKILYLSGWVTLLISVAVMMMLLGQNTETIAKTGVIICLLQCIPLVAVIFPTEIALRKKFDNYGNRK